MIGLSGIDTRALTRGIRERGMPHGVIAHAPDGGFDLDALVARARGLERPGRGRTWPRTASCLQPFVWEEGPWSWPDGYARPAEPSLRSGAWSTMG